MVKPELIVCLGATAAQALMGREFRITQRGVFLNHDLAKFVMATVLPSALLRAPDPERRHEEYRLFVKDLEAIPKKIAAIRLRA